jgi:hypothetical protein
MEFKKATLQPMGAQAKPTPVGPPIEVQINPASLRLNQTNSLDVGKDASRPKTQYQGSQATLTFDLIFDTADEGTTDAPVDVRTRTKELERFVLPAMGQAKAAPPRVQFVYGSFTVIGVMSSLNQDFDYFATNGVPLRAKCSVTIKEQKPEFDANLAGPGANKGEGATQPVPPTTGAGTSPPAPPADRTGTALAGESAADFANRMGLDPAAWKGLAAGLADPLRLEAGLQIDFSASLSLGGGIGIELGATSGAGLGGGREGGGAGPSTSGTPGPTRPPGPVPARAPADGAALTAQGGLSRALDRAAAAAAGTAVMSALVSFPTEPAASSGADAGRAAVATSVPSPYGATPRATGGGRAGPVESADPRALSYGFGVPLRSRLGVSRATTVGLLHQRHTTSTAPAADGVPETDDPTTPRWKALPAGADGTPTGAATRMPATGRGCDCGCGGARSTRGCGCSAGGGGVISGGVR